jgi:hypothetical protein
MAVSEGGGGAQLELMPPTRTNLTADETTRIEAAVKRDRAGRPPGAKNKTTREMLDFIRTWCGDPLERRFRWAQHTPETLSIELGCSKLEALQLLLKLWGELERYFYATLAQVDSAGNAVAPRLTMVFGGQHAHASGAAMPGRKPWEYDLEQIEQNQALSAPANDVSHGAQSHGDENDNDHSSLGDPAS